MSTHLRFTTLQSGFELDPTRSLSGELQRGQHLTLSGYSGCGKSQLLLAIAGAKKATSGQFYLDEREIDLVNLAWWRQQICFLPQKPVMGGETVKDALRLPWQLQAMEKQTSPTDEELQAALVRTGLMLTLTQDTHTLSGGEQQRLAISRALLMQRPIWLMDEPTAALDPTNRDRILALLQAEAITCVSISHDPHWTKHADWIHHMTEEESL
jgi:putative ABC transport system ATP-binding protein